MFKENFLYYSPKSTNSVNNSEPFIEFSYHYNWGHYNDSLDILRYMSTIDKTKNNN